MVKCSNHLIQKTIHDLPEEIMFEIFTRLPAECVLDCKSVCKLWRNLISSPSFPQNHLNHHLLQSSANFGKTSFLFVCYELGMFEFYYTEHDDATLVSKKTRIDINLRSHSTFCVGCSNGLICFRSSDNCGPVCICNPITREYVCLPQNERNYWWSGFGYVHSTNEYKVVRICHENRVGSNVAAVVMVYTLRSGNGWRNTGTIDDINMHSMSQFAGVFANESLHWVDSRGTIVRAFYLADEKFGELPAPPPYLTQNVVPYFDIKLGVLGDFLSATYCYNVGNCEIWLLKKNDDNNDFSWSKEFSFVLFGPDIPRPFVLTKNGRLLYYKWGKRNVYSYDPKASSFIMDVSIGKYIRSAIPHMNTFVSLKALGEKDTKTMEPVQRSSSSEETENGGKEIETMESGKRASSSEETENGGKEIETMEPGQRASLSEVTENNDKLKKPDNKLRDRLLGFYSMGVKKIMEAIQKLHLPKCC